MDCKYTAYDRIIHITEKLPKDKISEAIEIIQEDSFQDFLHCMTQLVYQKICRLQYSVSTFSDVPLATVKEIRSQITD